MSLRARAIALAGTIVVLTTAGLALQALGGPPDVAETLLPLGFAGLGAVVAVRAAANRLGWIFLAVGLLMSAGQAGDSLMFVARDRLDAITLAKTAAVATGWVWFPTIALLGTFCVLLFPNGRLPSQRWRWVAALALVGMLTGAVALIGFSIAELDTLVRDPYSEVDGPAAFGVAMAVAGGMLAVAVLASMASPFVRWRRATGIERHQLKWFGLGAIVQVFGLAASFLDHPAGTFVAEASTLALPTSAAVAITRYRLYEIDRILSRTLTYAAVVVLLVAIYVAAVTTVTAVTSPVTGDSPLAVAAATLVAAAAFQPARRRIQAAVERRFNRSRYNAAVLADAYRARLREELDLEAITADLVTTVQSAVQPRAASVWLSIGERR